MQRLAASSLAALMVAGTLPAPAFSAEVPGRGEKETATPIKHLVVIFQENVSFDHYFGTYPNAANLKGEPAFWAKPGKPSINGLTGTLLTANPNATNAANGSGATNPLRLERTTTSAVTNTKKTDYIPHHQPFQYYASTLTRIIVPFVGYSGRFVWHCHILEHEDNEMMRPYDVLPDSHTKS